MMTEASGREVSWSPGGRPTPAGKPGRTVDRESAADPPPYLRPGRDPDIFDRSGTRATIRTEPGGQSGLAEGTSPS